MRMDRPAATASEASLQMRSRPSRRPSTPLAAWKTALMVSAGNCRWGTWRMVARLALGRIGCGISSRAASPGPCSRRLPPTPSEHTSDMTDASRIGSIGGLVTCAKSCLKYAKSGWGGRVPPPQRGGVVRAPTPAPPRGPPEEVLADAQRARVRLLLLQAGTEVVEPDRPASDPLLVRMPPGQLGLASVVVEDLSRLSVDEQEPPGIEPPLLDDALLGDVEHARLGRHHHHPVVGHQVPCRTKPVAVETGANQPPVGEGDGGGTVPWLEKGGVEFVEGAPLLVDQRVAVPRLRDHHHHGVLDRAT